MSARSDDRSYEREFVSTLQQYANPDRPNLAALAALRRGLGKPPGQAAEMHQYVAPKLPPDASLWREDTFYIVGALFAWHQLTWVDDAGGSRPNFGASLHQLADVIESEGVPKLFVALLNCEKEELSEHLRHAVGLLRSKQVPIDWTRLLWDMQSWNSPSRRVQRAWAKAFWPRISPATPVDPRT